MLRQRTLKIAVAPAGFKGTLSPKAAAQAICTGLKKSSPLFQPLAAPMADGGLGTAEAILAAKGGCRIRVRVRDPLGRKITATYAMLADGKTAVIDMAAACGMALLRSDELDPMRASTFGVGRMILSALDHGARMIVVGLGDSATVDGGAGMAAALGARLLDRCGRTLAPGGGALEKLARIDLHGLEPRLKKTKFIAAADVTNPLLGVNGAARVFGPQKGASPQEVEHLAAGLVRFARIVARDIGADVRNLRHAGAAGGLGAGLRAFLGAELRSGAETVARAIGLKKIIRQSVLVITGEGRVDRQTAQGKAPARVAEIARELGRPVFALCGVLGPGWETLGRAGFAAIFPMSEAEADVLDKKTSYALLRDLAERIGRLLIECGNPV